MVVEECAFGRGAYEVTEAMGDLIELGVGIGIW